MAAEPPGAGHHKRPRPRLVAAIIAVAFFMQMLDGTIIATSLPAMAAGFGTDVAGLTLTDRMALANLDPQLAARLKVEAGA